MSSKVKIILSIIAIILIVPGIYLLYLEGRKPSSGLQSSNTTSRSTGENTAEQKSSVDNDNKIKRVDQSYKGRIQYNIVLLLDLSDRILQINPHKKTQYIANKLQVNKDKYIINNLLSIFGAEVKTKLYINSEDKIKIAVAPQPTGYSELLFSISKKLEIDMEKISIRDRREKLDLYISDFLKNVDSLYKVASEEQNLIGADIWTFFRDNLASYMSTSERDSTRNILVILTDGYLDFNSDLLWNRPSQGHRYSYMLVKKFRNNESWEKEFDTNDYGMIPIDKDFSTLEVLVLEIVPRVPLNPNEYKIIEKYWTKWFKEMKIQHFELHKTEDLPEQTKNIIETFILR